MCSESPAVSVVAVNIAVKGSWSNRETEGGRKSGSDLFGAPSYREMLRDKGFVLFEKLSTCLVAEVSAAFRNVVSGMSFIVRPLVAFDLPIDRGNVKSCDFGDLFHRMEAALEFVDNVAVVTRKVTVCVVH